ncbi:EAL domain-containing protein [Pleionea sediminis]|uniref:EAL domain-containing protein n=1 Tax=Pleionea sediminis TaxID=2569479 RepID=UPI0011867655|nr:EAL domain-containing protein [Pleionea sediminis]
MANHKCTCRKPLDFDIQMAFHPIVDIQKKEVFSYEALVRGMNGEGAGEILSRVNEENIYSFDQKCRTTAIQQIASLDKTAVVNINFLPGAIYDPETCLRRTLEVAEEYDFPRHRIVFEVTEHEKVENHELLRDIFKVYKSKGLRTAIDDFGEGFAGLNLLADFQPDFLKVDMKLVIGISDNPVKQAILSGIIKTAESLNIDLIAEGIETYDDYLFLEQSGIRYMQGFFFAKPEINHLPDIDWSVLENNH